MSGSEKAGLVMQVLVPDEVLKDGQRLAGVLALAAFEWVAHFVPGGEPQYVKFGRGGETYTLALNGKGEAAILTGEYEVGYSVHEPSPSDN